MPADAPARDRLFHAQDHAISRSGEPWGARLWLAFAAVMLVAITLESYGIRTWPMADDEVPSLVELGVLHIGAERFFSVPPEQIARLPKATPVWNAFQRTAIAWLPAGELSYRLPSLLCGMLTSALVFLLAARWRGLWFAVALAIVLHTSQSFILLQQLNRFYSLPLLLLCALLAAMWWPRGGTGMLALTGVLTVLTVLSHNITVAVLVLTFCAAAPAYLFGAVPKSLLLRSGVSAALSVLLYLLYLRPLVQGWTSTGNPTQVLVSFAAHAGVPTLALALLGAWTAVVAWRDRTPMLWWALMFAGAVCVFQVTTASMTWNPRYFLFFLPAVWVLAADAMDTVARKLASGALAAGWYAAVAVVLLPSLLSHFADGSRHDYRQAASVVASHARAGQPILSDDAETMTYYLPEHLRTGLEVRTRVTIYPQSEFFVVYRANAWMPLPRIPNRQMDLVGEIYRRRLDQFSHILRVYRVQAAPQS